SERHIQHTYEEILQQIALIIAPFIPSSHIQTIQLKRWDHAQTTHPVRTPFINDGFTHPLLIWGDAFLHSDDAAGRTRFESVCLSGIAAAELLVTELKRT